MANGHRRRTRSLLRIRTNSGDDEFLERLGAMGDTMLGFRVHLAEGEPVAFGNEDRVVAKTLLAARRESERTVRAALEHVRRFAGRRERQRADEIGARVVAPGCANLVFDALHRDPEVLLRACPAGGVDTG